MTATSNLEEYSAKDLSLLIESIDDCISKEKSLSAFTDMLIDRDDQISERMEVRLRNQNVRRSNKLDDLYGLRVAILNAHQIVLKRERVTQN